MSNKPWRCRFGMHRFVNAWTEDNQRYRQCRRCGKDSPGKSTSELDRYINIGGG